LVSIMGEMYYPSRWSSFEPSYLYRVATTIKPSLPVLEWQLFGYYEDGFVDIVFIDHQIIHIRLKEMGTEL
jgi:hypothetical protein